LHDLCASGAHLLGARNLFRRGVRRRSGLGILQARFCNARTETEGTGSDFVCQQGSPAGCGFDALRFEPKSFSLRFLCSLLFNSTAEFRVNNLFSSFRVASVLRRLNVFRR
jgi:hypothetical protein